MDVTAEDADNPSGRRTRLRIACSGFVALAMIGVMDGGASFALGAQEATAAAAPEPGGREGLETVRLGPGREAVAGEVIVRYAGAPRERLVRLDSGAGVRETLRELRRDPAVRWAAPNAVARASLIPRDPGRSGKRKGWVEDQWNFLAPPPVGTACSVSAPCGINAPRAWSLLRDAGRRDGRKRNGKRGPLIAVVDTGVAYRNRGRRHLRSPDLTPGAFASGRDFIGNDDVPLDKNGHGTHVASTIIEQTGNREAVTGLASGLKLLPVRVLNAGGSGSARDVARGIRFAARKGARVINLSLEFGVGFKGCGALRPVCRAIGRAERGGALVVGAAGNAGAASAQMPGKVAFAVAATTIRGCLSEFSSSGPGVAISAPGGGFDADDGGSHCDPGARGPGIVQLTLRAAFSGNYRKFGYPHFEGTSMSAPHVSAAAGLVISSQVLRRKLGRRPSGAEVGEWLRCTARPVADPTTADRYGAGILDLAAALRRGTPCPALD